MPILDLIRKREETAEAAKLAALVKYRKAVLTGDARNVFELAEAAGVEAATLRKHAALLDVLHAAERAIAKGEPDERRMKAALAQADGELAKLSGQLEAARKRWLAAADELNATARELDFERATKRTVESLLPWVQPGNVEAAEKPLRDESNWRVAAALRGA